jgi:pyridoxal phosphate enzyme (YggS family)
MESEVAAIVGNILDVRAAITAELHTGSPAACELVAVSKLKPASAVEGAFSGSEQRDFGENFVPELCQKAREIERAGTSPGIRWHLVGELIDDEIELLAQCPGLHLVHSCPSVSAAQLLDSACAKHRTAPLGILLQIATGGSEQSGVDPSDAPTAAVAVRDSCSSLELRGVMCVGQYGADSTSHYQQLLTVREAVAAALGVQDESSLLLSMGMSEDFRSAVRLGATHVRVGSTIFGARNGRL